MSNSYKYSVNDRFDSIVFKDKKFINNASGWVSSYADEFHIEWGRHINTETNVVTRFGVNTKEHLISGCGITVCGESIGLD